MSVRQALIPTVNRQEVTNIPSPSSIFLVPASPLNSNDEEDKPQEKKRRVDL